MMFPATLYYYHNMWSLNGRFFFVRSPQPQGLRILNLAGMFLERYGCIMSWCDLGMNFDLCPVTWDLENPLNLNLDFLCT